MMQVLFGLICMLFEHEIVDGAYGDLYCQRCGKDWPSGH